MKRVCIFRLQEFPLLSREYVEQAFVDGRIRVQGRKVRCRLQLFSPECGPFSIVTVSCWCSCMIT